MPDAASNHLYAPKHWPLWCLFALIYPVTLLPLSWQRPFGKALGFLLFHLGPHRRHIADVNLKLCFPELTDNERLKLLRDHFSLYGMSLIESFSAWWMPRSRFHPHASYEGLEHLDEALSQKNGVLLLSGHFTTLEIGLRLLGKKQPFHIMYRRHKNPLFEETMSGGREAHVGKTIDRKDVRGILSSLKAGNAVWYGPDQDYGRKHSVFASFMGIPAATVTGTQRWARVSGAAVVPYFVERTNKGYHVKVLPALSNFPTDDAEQDATRINQIFEQQIRLHPENYLWTHRRFKTRPKGEARPY